MRFNKQKLIIFAALIKFEMDDYVKQTIQIILHETMKTKAQLEIFRFKQEVDLKRDYQDEINKCLDRINELDIMFERIRNQY